MEVSTVSPSPASPTEGDDLCETDVTSVAIHSVTLLICLCGLAGNGAVIGLLNLKIPNYRFFVLAVTDFLFLLLTVPSALLLVENVFCSPVMPLLYLSFLFQLSVVSYYYWALLSLMPRRLTFLCPSDEQELCRAALISMYIIMLLLFVIPMLISITVDFINSNWGSQQQQPRRRDIVILIIALFTLFLRLWNFLQQLSYIVVSSEVFLLLACIHSSTKSFIYFLAGRCWRPCSMGSLRLSLQRVIEEQKKKLHGEMILP
nr:mas-related G-protein coupled receptor member X2-like [Zonotrichia albicollis]